jgi:uncharacterized coiled-coil protein SlyX
MKKDERMVAILEEQLRLSAERERHHLEQINQLSKQIFQLTEQNVQLSDQLNRLAIQLEEQTKTIESLEEALLQKGKDISSLSGKNRGLAKLLNNKSEKITPEATPATEPEMKAPSPKERGNNGARRNAHDTMEVEVVDIWPDDPAFDKEKAVALGVVDSIRYAFYPCRIVKKIYRQHNFVMGDKVYTAGSPPRTPFMNSNYEASFIAGHLQFRYIYSMPVERIVKYYRESGFDLNKPTAHGLISKTYSLLEGFDEALRKAIHTDSYIRLDETYHKIINERKNEKGKDTCKGYFWSALANNLQLVHFFYEDGSRSKEVFSDYLDKSYRGAVHTDGLTCYKEIETDTYPNAIRISCIQHAKRKFLDIEKDEQAQEIVFIINRLYRIEHEMRPEWDAGTRLAFRNAKAPPVLKELKDKLLLLKADPELLPSTPLAVATNYLLNEFDAIENYLLDADYTLDNNPIYHNFYFITPFPVNN